MSRVLASPESRVTGRNWQARLDYRANALIPGASLAVFRMLFGAVAAIGAFRFLANGWVDSLYVAPEVHLTYAWFDWVQPWPSPFMHLHMAALGACGVAIALGWRYRLATAAYLVGFAYTELIDASLYLNHYWWVTMAAAVMLFLPLDRMWSLDARSGRVAQSAFTEAWVLWTVRSLLAVVYVFAGFAKLQPDWLANAMPMKLWLADRTHLPVVGQFLDEPAVAFAASWAGAIFDCTIVLFLLWARSRPFAYVAVVTFHLATAVLFQIGMFPWLMIAATLVFFPPNWPTRLASRFGLELKDGNGTTAHHLKRAPVKLLVMIAVLQLVIPLRHYAYPDNVRWTEEGYYGSWRVMLTEKAGTLRYLVTNPATGVTTPVEPTSFMEDWQAAQASIRPDLLLTGAHILAEQHEANGLHDVEVRAENFVSFNARPYQAMVDSSIDLTTVPRGPGHKDFIVELQP